MDPYDPPRRDAPTDLDELSRRTGLGTAGTRGRPGPTAPPQVPPSPYGGAPSPYGAPPRPQPRDPSRSAEFRGVTLLLFALSLVIVAGTAGLIYREWHAPPAGTPDPAVVAQRRAELVLAADASEIAELRAVFAGSKMKKGVARFGDLQGEPIVRATVTANGRLSIATRRGSATTIHGGGRDPGLPVTDRAPSGGFALSDIDPRAPLRILLAARTLGRPYRERASSVSLERTARGTLQWRAVWTGAARTEIVADTRGRKVRKAAG